MNDTFVINSRLVNVAKVGYNRSNLLRSQQGTGAKDYQQASSSTDLQNLNPLLQQSTPPSISIANYTSCGNPILTAGGSEPLQYADELD